MDLALHHLEEVTAFARRLTSNPADADDLVQITYERALRSWRTLNDPGSCRSWLFRIARNAWIDQIRADKARPELQLVEEQLDGEVWAPPEGVERVALIDLDAAIRRLPASQAEAVLLSDLWGFTYQEIAEIAGCPIGTVRSRIARGRIALVKSMTATTGLHRRHRDE